jgi:hypothetical protein
MQPLGIIRVNIVEGLRDVAGGSLTCSSELQGIPTVFA